MPKVKLGGCALVDYWLYTQGKTRNAQDKDRTSNQTGSITLTDYVISLSGENLAGRDSDGYPLTQEFPELKRTQHIRFNTPDSGDAWDYLQEQDQGKTRLEGIFDAINQARSEEKSVYIHCSAGQSRSAGVIIRYIMERTECTFEEVHHYLETLRYGVDLPKQIRSGKDNFMTRIRDGR